MPGWIIVIAIVAVVVLFGIGVYNSLVSKRDGKKCNGPNSCTS